MGSKNKLFFEIVGIELKVLVIILNMNVFIFFIGKLN